MSRDADQSTATDHIGWSRARVEQRGLIREVVFGAQDGLLTTLGLVAGVSGATAGRSSVLIAGFAGAIAGMLAMGAGAYISNRSQRDVQRAEIELERSELERNPVREMAELVELFTGDGLPEEDARVVAGMIAKHPEAMLKAMAEKELGIPTEGGNALLQTFVISAAFLLGAVVPILPWFVAAQGPIVTIGRFGPSPALLLAVLLTGAALFAVGGFKGRLAGLGTMGGGMQMTGIGLGCATIAYLLGSVIPGLFGIHPIG